MFWWGCLKPAAYRRTLIKLVSAVIKSSGFHIVRHTFLCKNYADLNPPVRDNGQNMLDLLTAITPDNLSSRPAEP